MRYLVIALAAFLVTSTTASAQSANANWAAKSLGQTLSDVARRVTPSVVHIQVEKRAAVAPELLELYRDYDLSPLDLRDQTRRASGSGVIVSAAGRILTNHHVIESAREVVVVLSDQRRVPARVVGSDPRTDVAVIELMGEGRYPWVRMGDSDELRVGELVLAVGSPFDFQSTVTVGVVSAKGRRGLSESEIQDYIQIDAAVNPGNSGGPLFDINGRVVGINTAIYSPGDVETNSGISFAIPSNMVGRVATELESVGRVRHARVGLLTRTITEVDGDPTRSGAEVEWVLPDSPALRAGIRRGDVIIRVDGEPITSTTALRQLILARGVGAELIFTVTRDNQIVDLETETAGWSDVAAGPSELPDTIVEWAGLTLGAPDPQLRAHFGLVDETGALVLRVEPGSDAALMGLVAGDVVAELGGQRVDGLPDLERQLAGLDTPRVVVMAVRGNSRFYSILPSSP